MIDVIGLDLIGLFIHSRTEKGAKGPGYEHWSRRAWGKGTWMPFPGRWCKTMTHRRERRDGKREVREADDEPRECHD